METPPASSGEPHVPDPKVAPSWAAAAPTGPSEALAIATIVLAFGGGVVQVMPVLLFMVNLIASGGELLTAAPIIAESGTMTFMLLISLFSQLINLTSGALLLCGATGLLARRHSGRRMIITGCLLVIGQLLVTWLAMMVINAMIRASFGDFIDEVPSADSAMTGMVNLVNWLSVLMLAFPVTTAILATRPAVHAYCRDASPFALSNVGADIGAAVGRISRAAGAGSTPRGTTVAEIPAEADREKDTSTRPKVDLYKRPSTSAAPTAAAAVDPAAADPPGPPPFPSAPTEQIVPPRPSPLGTIPRGVRARDAAAAVLVLAALVLPWSFTTEPIRGEGDALHITGIVVASVVLILAIAVPYLRVAFAVGTTEEPPLDRLVRRLAACAYALVALAFVIGDVYLVIAEISNGYGGHGIGAAISFAAAGALLAVAPRAPGDRTHWQVGTSAAMWTAAILILASGVATLASIRLASTEWVLWPPVVMAGVTAVSTIVLASVAAIAAAGSVHLPWRLTLVGCAAAIVVAVGASGLFDLWSVENFRANGSLFLPAWVAAGTCAWIAGTRSEQHAASGWTWLAACRNGLLIACAIAVADLAIRVGGLVARGMSGYLEARDLIAALLALVSAAALAAGMSQLRPVRGQWNDQRPARNAAIVATVVAAISGVTALIVDSYEFWMLDVVLLGLSATVLITLLLASPIRSLYGLPPLNSALPNNRAVPGIPRDGSAPRRGDRI